MQNQYISELVKNFRGLECHEASTASIPSCKYTENNGNGLHPPPQFVESKQTIGEPDQLFVGEKQFFLKPNPNYSPNQESSKDNHAYFVRYIPKRKARRLQAQPIGAIRRRYVFNPSKKVSEMKAIVTN
eukprot:Platyproteum_vivax@DN8859_c0_g1_i1.p1